MKPPSSLEFNPFPDTQTDKVEELELYQYVFPIRAQHPTFACIGFVNAMGAHGPLFEIQTRWATQVFKGNVGLPSVAEMKTDIERTKSFYYEVFGKHIIFVSFKSSVFMLNNCVYMFDYNIGYIALKDEKKSFIIDSEDMKTNLCYYSQNNQYMKN